MADRRRINGPGGQTCPSLQDEHSPLSNRSRQENEVRAACKEYKGPTSVSCLADNAADLKTGVTPSASGSAYLELEPRPSSGSGGMKLTCTVHGPRSLPRSAPFSPHMVLSTHVKYAPFATRQRRGYLRDSSERDLSVHLETALRGTLIADRWPKSGVDVVVTIVEGELAQHVAVDQGTEEWNMMNILSGCITVAAAAIADAGIDCVDTVCGGVAALVADKAGKDEQTIVLDPVPSEHGVILAACCVAYLPERDEVTNLWLKGRLSPSNAEAHRELVAKAIYASRGTGMTIAAALQEALSTA